MEKGGVNFALYLKDNRLVYTPIKCKTPVCPITQTPPAGSGLSLSVNYF